MSDSLIKKFLNVETNSPINTNKSMGSAKSDNDEPDIFGLDMIANPKKVRAEEPTLTI